ncbi:MAG: S-methyl-5-thioribose-1-phosphate isomerase [Dehalococcoidia bacterium]|nr:S-methyl-5-thioribose-1-phosphate isomerase [Dehalococcoidia bacterium]
MQPIEWLDDRLRILDQSKLPHEQCFIELADYHDVALAIKEMQVRGAPAIGIAAAYGIALGAQSIKSSSKSEFTNRLNQIMEEFAATRPTAVNLFQAINGMERASTGSDVPAVKQALIDKARQIHREEIEATRQLSHLGAELIHEGFTILTHCNAGPLATAGYGTALGIIMAAREQGKRIEVLATETRPLLQGARLTVWELKQKDIPVTLITDSMAGYFINRSKVNCVIVGADRIAANGDVANKIGTYTLAVLARENALPFYVAAPTSTIDFSLPSGGEIPIEERSPLEVTHFQGIASAPGGVKAANPAFDVTPHRYISAIITERGIIKGRYKRELAKMAPQKQTGR